ncbi:MAG: transcription termination factor NusA [Candidatus Cardinium sp.]|uniref:transcription termination factor NusA n=1 Tax=Candidatus Cardinium sp. TP TaxID=2961955 RepID=UPI0021AF4E87|nr:transcription termination factor NusA [Candidatus Cardinium sp. TP]MCT4696790.1 transcription termination factor NusA [Candidatus Cardinium sp. TP]MDN5246797.1 transcription termination factor NusA [Candidatus Cardinium sp.]
MDSNKLVESFAEFAKSKNIDRPTVIRILEDVFRSVMLSKFGNSDNFDIIINLDKGDLQIWRFRNVVADDAVDVGAPNKISLSEARKIEADFELGEELSEEIKISDFGRRLILTAKQMLIQKIRELEKEALYNKYEQLVGGLISAEVNQILSKEVILLDDENNELFLPKSEQIPKDQFKKGEHIRAVIYKVAFNNATPRVILSRASPLFLERLFENEIPEIQDGLIAIRKIVRDPGARAKVAVETFDDRIDPVGACVGIKGSRIHGITKELQYENIDIINYTDNLELYIARALNPACINRVEQSGERIAVYLDPDQVALAIGKGGQNIKLASRLIGKEIDVYRDIPSHLEAHDIPLAAFSDTIEPWILEALHQVGLDSAKSVLTLPKATLEQRVDLEQETIDEIYAILDQTLNG